MSSSAHDFQWLTLAVRWIWECSIIAQMLVLVLLLRHRNFRLLPRLTIYVGLNLCQAGLLWILYAVPGINADRVMTIAWETEAVTLFAQALATAEVLGLTLKPYPAIWGLGWRALTAVATVALVFVLAVARRAGPVARLFELNRGYHIVFACAVIACLVLVAYYSVPVARAYRLLLIGFCSFSCLQILINTVIEALFQRSFLQFGSLWDLMTVASFLGVQIVWAVALWRAVPIPTGEPPAVSGSGYRQISPAINEELRTLNEKLARFWKPEARPQ